MKGSLSDRIVLVLEKLPEIITYAGVVVLLADDLLSSALNYSPLLDVPKRLSLVAAALGALSLSFHLHRRKLNTLLKLSQREHLGVEELIPSSKPLDLEELFHKAKTIRILSLAGTKLARLGDKEVLQDLRSAADHKQVTILLANPFSQAIITRYERDEPSTYESGLGGLERRLRNLHSLRQTMTANEKKRFEVRVYDCYPTISIIQSDDDFFSTVYAFRQRGVDCPKIHAKRGGRYAEFLLTQFQKVYESAQSLDDWIKENPQKGKH